MSRSKRYQLNKDKFLSAQELAAIAAAAEALTTRDRLLVQLALNTGGRASEILAIRPKDLDPAECSVQLYGLKDSDDRVIPLPERLFSELQNFALDLPSTKPIFDISYRRFEQIWKSITEKKLHSARHTFAIELFKRTQNLKVVQVALGHRSIANTMIYADYHYSTSELRKAMGL